MRCPWGKENPERVVKTLLLCFVSSTVFSKQENGSCSFHEFQMMLCCDTHTIEEDASRSPGRRPAHMWPEAPSWRPRPRPRGSKQAIRLRAEEDTGKNSNLTKGFALRVVFQALIFVPRGFRAAQFFRQQVARSTIFSLPSIVDFKKPVKRSLRGYYIGNKLEAILL